MGGIHPSNTTAMTSLLLIKAGCSRFQGCFLERKGKNEENSDNNSGNICNNIYYIYCDGWHFGPWRAVCFPGGRNAARAWTQVRILFAGRMLSNRGIGWPCPKQNRKAAQQGITRLLQEQDLPTESLNNGADGFFFQLTVFS